MSNGLPVGIKIGPHIYKVRSDGEAMYEASSEAGEVLDGHISHDKMVISIREGDHALTHRAEVLLHEVLHGILVTTSRKEDIGEKEEEVVRALSVALLAVLRDNPEFVKYLTADG